MKNAFKFGFLALFVTLTVAACSGSGSSDTTDSLKADSAATTDSLKSDSAATTDSLKSDSADKADTAKKM
ncbi:hypothetical protein [Mucilaginibacter myungsuensis]|uniref:Entericidin n=1 Tax=Mucilaginibacter myungsuensis TaxID=649104 RepID=A0A929PW99_9SPHI|nr:hypothetical protein [Mucilaginibacter myungsuensis]MBE9660952.1 hypothetical protein [Mucilaginibacter myungsuensis]